MPADPVLAFVRALHFAATIVLFGQFAFVLLVAPERQVPPLFRHTISWSIATFLVTAIAWIALEAVSMSGVPAREALSPTILGTVMTQTQYGRVWLARMVVSLVLIALVAIRSQREQFAIGACASGLLLVALAGMGHGGSGRGLAGWIHLATDGAHLLAAGMWLGALVPLLVVFDHARRAGGTQAVHLAVDATQRFSTLGIVSMATILLTGAVNSYYMLPSPAALVRSGYGLLLLAKIVAFALIIGIAGVNRLVFTPRLVVGAHMDHTAGKALSRLKANAIVECLLGFGIIAVVGKLGITVPGAHQ